MNLRLKFHDYPGDIPKWAKVALLEGRPEDATLVYQEYSRRAARRYKRLVRMKERAVLKGRARIMIEVWL